MYERIQLPYDLTALEPAIGGDTMNVHYNGHHKAYTDNLNKLTEGLDQIQNMDILDLLLNMDLVPADKRRAIRNNGGGFYNHNLYFGALTPNFTPPKGHLLDKINSRFGSLDALQDKMTEAATATLFGSGWAWLIQKDGDLDVVISANQDLPEKFDSLLLPLDMWEHAYYLNYKNKKGDYVKNYFPIVNWDVVAKRLK